MLYPVEEDSLHYPGNLSRHPSKSSSKHLQRHSMPILLPSGQDPASDVADGIFNMSLEEPAQILNQKNFIIGDEPLNISGGSSPSRNGSLDSFNILDGSYGEQSSIYQTSTPQKTLRTDIFSPRSQIAPSFLIDFKNHKDGVDPSSIIRPSSTSDLISFGTNLSQDSSFDSKSKAVFDPLGVVRLDSLEDQPTPRRRISSTSSSGDPSSLSSKTVVQVQHQHRDTLDDSKIDGSVFLNLDLKGTAELRIHRRQEEGSAADFSNLIPLLQPHNASASTSTSTTATKRAPEAPISKESAVELNSESPCTRRRTASEDLEMSFLVPQKMDLHKSLPDVCQHDADSSDGEDVFEQLGALPLKHNNPSRDNKNTAYDSHAARNSEKSCEKENQVKRFHKESNEKHDLVHGNKKGHISVDHNTNLNPANQASVLSKSSEEISSIEPKSRPRGNHTFPKQRSKSHCHLTSPKTCIVHPLLSSFDQFAQVKVTLDKSSASAKLENQENSSDLDHTKHSSTDHRIQNQYSNLVPRVVSSTEPIRIEAPTTRNRLDLSDSTTCGNSLDSASELSLQDTHNNNRSQAWKTIGSAQDASLPSPESTSLPLQVSLDEDELSQLSLTDSDCGGTATSVSDFDDSISFGSYDSHHDGSYKIISAEIPSWLSVGEQVQVGNVRTGLVKFVGNTTFRPGVWVGVALNTASGKHNGCVQGVRYFTCKPKHGIFVRPDRLCPTTADSPSPSITTAPSSDMKQQPKRKSSSRQQGSSTSRRDVVGSGDAKRRGSRKGVISQNNITTS